MPSPFSIRRRRFDELDGPELYALLRLRAQIFVVEQVCPYLDLDDRDQDALHILAYEDDELRGCARILESPEGPVIGRIVVAAAARGRGLGARLLEESIAARPAAPGTGHAMHAQAHLEDFYGRFGFERVGEVFLEDGIPHLKMLRRA